THLNFLARKCVAPSRSSPSSPRLAKPISSARTKSPALRLCWIHSKFFEFRSRDHVSTPDSKRTAPIQNDCLRRQNDCLRRQNDYARNKAITPDNKTIMLDKRMHEL